MPGFFKGLLWFVIAGLFLVALVYTVKHVRTPEIDDKKPIIGKVTRKDLIQRITFAGVITSKRRSIITAPYAGYVKDLYVKIGDKVKKNDALVSIAASLDSLEPVHPLRAPFFGVVTLVRKSPGEFVKENDSQDYVLRIDDVSKFFVEARVPEIDRLKVKIGQDAIIKVSPMATEPLHGVVKQVALAPDEKNQQGFFGGRTQVEYQVFIEITDENTQINPGMSAIIDVIAASLKQVLTLGHEFILEENDKTFVTLKDGAKREIKIGLQNDEEVEIISGVNEGDEVRQIEFAP